MFNTNRNLPAHTSREVLMILGGLTTCDPSNIDATIEVFLRCLLYFVRNHSSGILIDLLSGPSTGEYPLLNYRFNCRSIFVQEDRR